jgi:hypothetical protein
MQPGVKRRQVVGGEETKIGEWLGTSLREVTSDNQCGKMTERERGELFLGGGYAKSVSCKPLQLKHCIQILKKNRM